MFVRPSFILICLVGSLTTGSSKRSNLRIEQPIGVDEDNLQNAKLSNYQVSNVSLITSSPNNFSNNSHITRFRESFETYNVTDKRAVRKRRAESNINVTRDSNDGENKPNIFGASAKNRSTVKSKIQVTSGGKDDVKVFNECKNILKVHYFIKDIPIGTNNIVRVGGCRISERFQGQVQYDTTGTLSLSDTLKGNPASPLKLVTSYNKRENLKITKDCSNGKCGISLAGRGPSGIDGTGSISIMFIKDKTDVQLSFRANGANKAVVMFYKRNGKRIQKLIVNLEKSNDYRFVHQEGGIAGMAIYSSGDTLKWHKFSLVGICYNN